MGDNPSHFKGDNLPVERVSWEDCQEFIKRLSIQTGIRFRLPTEAEWEYAARGGQYSKHNKYAGANDDAKSDYIWLKENSQSQSHEVKTKLPNELELYDMCGNISEWCSDWYFNSYANNGERVNPQGPASGVAKVYRGGSWDDKPMNCRVSKRFSMNPIFKNKLVGLRLAATNI
jgi:formylglycine-generating enzyme required for sulfatase activity